MEAEIYNSYFNHTLEQHYHFLKTLYDDVNSIYKYKYYRQEMSEILSDLKNQIRIKKLESLLK